MNLIHTIACALCLLGLVCRTAAVAQSKWTMWGGDIHNTRFSSHKCINLPALRTGMKTLWTYTANDTAAPTPTVCGGFVYFSDWRSNIYKFRVNSNKPIWAVSVRKMIPKERSVGVRVTPTLSSDCSKIFVLTQWTVGAYLVAINAANGANIYVSHIDNRPFARVTMSPTFYNNNLFVGMSSSNEGGSMKGEYRGTMYRINALTGKVVWANTVCPPGFFGCSMWGSSPVIDERRNLVCTGTGNNYAVPAKVAQCFKAAAGNVLAQKKCSPANNHADAMMCFNIANGAIKWSKPMLLGADLYLPGVEYGPDIDFAQGPILIQRPNQAQDLLLATSKGSQPMAFDPATGALKWGPVKVTAEKNPFTMFGSCTNGQYYCTGQFWFSKKLGQVTCLLVNTGKVAWKWTTTAGGVYGPLTCTEKVVFAPLFNDLGSLVALNIQTGAELGHWNAGKTLFTGPAIVNGVAFLGQGYNANGGVNGKQIFAVQLPLTGPC